MKGAFELRLSLPKYTEIWDVAIVINYLKTLDPPQGLTLKNLTLKSSTLLCLLSGQRCQTIHKFNIDFIQKLPTVYRISVREKLKHTRPGKHQEPFDFLEYPHDKRLCIMEYMTEYIDRTERPRGNHKNLLISYVKPHQPVSKATVAKGIKAALRVSGIDTKKFTAHCCRTASTLSNKVARLNLCEILKSAGWSNTQTFAEFYDKPISNLSQNFGNKLLERFNKQPT